MARVTVKAVQGKPEAMGELHLGRSADNLVADIGGAGSNHADVLCCCLGKIQNPTLDEWPAIIDAHNNGLAIALVGNFHLRAEAEGAVSCSHVRSVHTFAGCRLGTESIPGGVTTTWRSMCCIGTQKRKRCDGNRGES